MENIPGSENKNIIREPLLAGVLSFLSLGLGQAYNGQRRKGYLFFICYLGLGVLYLILLKVFKEPISRNREEILTNSPSYLITVLCSFIIWALNIYDAYQSAKQINENSIFPDFTPGKSTFIFLRNIVVWFVVFIILGVLFVILTAFLGRIFK